MNGLRRGGVRLLKPGEIALAKTLYQSSIIYHKVWIHRDSYLPFNTQDNMTAMTPNGEMWFQDGVYQDDFSMSTISFQHLFLHEIMHVLQYQRGMWVRLRGSMSWAVDYSYSLDKGKLSDYSMEQQACIVSDYWVLTNYGFFGTEANIKCRDYSEGVPESILFAKYKKILKGFPS